MYGAMIGDIVGSTYEFAPIKTTVFPLFSEGCSFTDDSVMTAAVAEALLQSRESGIPFKRTLVQTMQAYGRRYPHPQGGYGNRFMQWLNSPAPQPYNSFGNGSAMRVSPCALIAVTMEETLDLAAASAEVTHNHPEGVKGAKATAAAVFMARHGHSMGEIRRYIEKTFYSLDFTLDDIRGTYRFDETCQGTVPQALVAFLESTSFEDAIRKAVSLGGDSDTLAAITGSVAWSYYRAVGGPLPEDMQRILEEGAAYIPAHFRELAETFDEVATRRGSTDCRGGFCSPISI